MSRETLDISGFGGSYEWGCQTMLDAGMRWLADHPDFDFPYKESPQVIGVCLATSDLCRDLDKTITDAVKSHGATGAMRQAVIHHLAEIAKNENWIVEHGYENWVLEGKKLGWPTFMFDGTIASCPVTELSRKMDRPSECSTKSMSVPRLSDFGQ